MRRLAALAAAWVLLASASLSAADLERVVMVMRHGVRAPFVAAVTPAGTTDQAWPLFPSPYGQLTPHGARAMTLLGQYDREAWARNGLLGQSACPPAGAVVTIANNAQRTIATAEAWLAGAFPDCGLGVDHQPEGTTDALFQPFEAGTDIDSDAAYAAAISHSGGLDRLRAIYRPALDRLGRVMGCCAVDLCAAAGQPAHCSLADLPGDMVPASGRGRPKVSGIFDYASTAAQTLMLEYLEGLPLNDVGWGRAGPEDLELVTALHTMKAHLIQRPPNIAAFGARAMAERISAALSGDAKITVLVGHDTNINDLAGLLDLHFKVPGYGADVPAPGGALGFERVRDETGEHLRAFYRTQSLDQIRDLMPLDATNPPPRQEIAIPGCAQPCTPAAFADLVVKLSR